MSCSREYYTAVRSFVTIIAVTHAEQVKGISSKDWPRLAVVIVHQTRSSINDVPLAAHDDIRILAALHLRNCIFRAPELVLLIKPLQPGQEQGSHAALLQETGQAASQYLRANWQHVTDLTIQGYQLNAVDMRYLLPSDWPEFSAHLNTFKVAGLKPSKEIAVQVKQKEESVNHTQLLNWTVDSDNVIVAELVHGEWNPRPLSLHANPQSGSADLLAMDAAAWPGIVSLCLKDVCFSSSAISALATAKVGTVNKVFTNSNYFHASSYVLSCWPQLDCLDLQCSAVGAGGIAALVAAFLPELRWLNLSQNQLYAEGGRMLAQGSWPRLKALDIGGNALGDEGMLYVARGKWPKLKKITVNSNNVTIKGVQCLRKASWPKLETLNLHHRTGSMSLWEVVFRHGITNSNMLR